jgi:hypothetical protein
VRRDDPSPQVLRQNNEPLAGFALRRAREFLSGGLVTKCHRVCALCHRSVELLPM